AGSAAGASRKAAVLYIAAEGERGLSARVEAFRQKKLDRAEDNDPPLYLLSTRLNLVTEIDQLIDDICATLGDEVCILIIVDTLNRTIDGSESKDEDMSRYIDSLSRLHQAFGALVLVIHHCGVEGSRPRGHTSLGGAADAQLAVNK